MKKRTLACLLAGILAVGSLAGCGKKEEQTSGAKTESGYAKNAKLKVWGSQEDQEMYKKMIEEFQKENPGSSRLGNRTGCCYGCRCQNRAFKRCVCSSRCI